MMETELDGGWVRAERSVPDEAGQEIIQKAVQKADAGQKTVSISVTGDDSSFDGTLLEQQLSEYFEIVTREQVDTEDGDSLPEGFFDDLSARQRIFLRILLDHDEPVTGPEIREEMRTTYDQEVSDSGSGTAGIISGFTRKYGEEFRKDLIRGGVSHFNDEGSRVFEHWLGEKYEDELRDYFDV